MKEGMRKVNIDAFFFSWFYNPSMDLDFPSALPISNSKKLSCISCALPSICNTTFVHSYFLVLSTFIYCPLTLLGFVASAVDPLFHYVAQYLVQYCARVDRIKEVHHLPTQYLIQAIQNLLICIFPHWWFGDFTRIYVEKSTNLLKYHIDNVNRSELFLEKQGQNNKMSKLMKIRSWWK